MRQLKQLLKEIIISVTGVFTLAALTLLIAFSIPLPAQSAEVELTLGGWSRHLGVPDLNSRHAYRIATLTGKVRF